MQWTCEQARTQTRTAEDRLRAVFPEAAGEQGIDAVFLDAGRTQVLGFIGLPYRAPVCARLLNDAEICGAVAASGGDCLIRRQDGRVSGVVAQGDWEIPPRVAEKILAVCDSVLAAPGYLNDKGELILDLLADPVGPHYAVNLLLGDRSGADSPLLTTPKSAVDRLGRGSFRAGGAQQVLATRCVLDLEENGEPANRQFYLVENGRQIFYSANVHENVASATCCHSQGRTVITYETACGLRIVRTIFILPQKPGMPCAVEAQRVQIVNLTDRPRNVKIIMTGVFGIAQPGTIANDVVYANVVVESEVYYEDGRAAALTLHPHPAEEQHQKWFAALLSGGTCLDDFCTSQSEFVGNGSLTHPDLVSRLPNRFTRKAAPFFAMGKTVPLEADGSAVVDEFVGLMERADGPFEDMLSALLTAYRDPGALTRTLAEVSGFWESYGSYLIPEGEDRAFSVYVARNLPFQVLYQTYVSRSFAWTQKSYRETGFREIQDLYASMAYLCAMGWEALAKNLLGNWIRNVWRMGFAFHNFTRAGKEPGMCSDDQLWLVEAVHRYVKLTGDADFLEETYPVADDQGGERPLWETILAILTYSGCISVGAHGLPLLDHADWNDTLRLDPAVLDGPAKEEAYNRQLASKSQAYGAPWENTLSESVMNACLLKIAADEASELFGLIGRQEERAFAARLSRRVAESMQQNAWKGNFFARCLINDGRPYTYLGARGDNLALEEGADGCYFLNSYSWALLSGVATEEQTAVMLDTVKRRLMTDAGLKLCTLVDFDRLKVKTGTALYFPGDRENGGVFKHAAMMAAVASLKAAKTVADEKLARELMDLAFFMMDKTLPYGTLQDPFVRKGNPRFCTQYNNSETGENIGPMLSGTASWLTLAVYEYLGVQAERDAMVFAPVLRAGQDEMAYTLCQAGGTLHVTVHGRGKRRPDSGTVYTLDGSPARSRIDRPRDGKVHELIISL